MDTMVLETQKWLNKTYSSGLTLNGKTGWPTIYALRRALQKEMGITALSDNFGPTTESYFKTKVEPTFKSLDSKPNKNIVKILQGGMWCKGINPLVNGSEAVDGLYTKYTRQAIGKFQEMAGLTPDQNLTAMLMKAILDMSAFALLGDRNIQMMQQELNRKYNNYFGLLPCDGIYQRETNQALIYALQAEIGMDANTANGFYGPGTTAKTPTLKVGSKGNTVKILQWALYVNGFNKSGTFDGYFSANLGKEFAAYRKFMNLSPYNEVADMKVIKGLLSSSGNVNRAASACDMATQLTKQQAQTIKNNGFSIVGRYLTGTVGVGANKRDKNLTVGEIQNITSVGLNIFPIYQDGGWYEEYFTGSQGFYDGRIAGDAAYKLGFPAGATIYFAVDVDIQEGDIQGTVIPYIKEIRRAIDVQGMYKVGIYATRNVCQKAIDCGAVTHCFVSDMSTGFSGNLGFPMPKEWAFDQFYEHSELGFPIDKVAVSGRDFATGKFNTSIENLVEYHALQFLKKLKWDSLIRDIGFSFGREIQVLTGPPMDIFFRADSTVRDVKNKAGMSIIVKNGKMDKPKYMDPILAEMNKYSNITNKKDMEPLLLTFAANIENGLIKTGMCAKNGKVGTMIQIIKYVEDTFNGEKIRTDLCFTIEVYPVPLFASPLEETRYKEIHDDLIELHPLPNINLGGIMITVGALALCILLIEGLPILATAASAILKLIVQM